MELIHPGYRQPRETNELNEIAYFLQNHNQSLETGSVTLLSDNLVNAFQKFGVYPLTIRSEFQDREILGTVLVLPISIGKNDAAAKIFGCISFLCVHKLFRGRGVAKRLIVKLTDLGQTLQIGQAYSIGAQSRSDNSILLKRWFRPILHRTAKELGFDFPSYRKFGDRSDYRTNFAYNTNLPSHVEMGLVCPIIGTPGTQSFTAQEVLDFYLTNTSKMKLRYQPTLEEWYRWIMAFPTYAVSTGGKLIGLFALTVLSSLMSHSKGAKEGKFSVLLLFVATDGNGVDVLRSFFSASHTSGVSVAMGYEMGDVTAKDLGDVKAIKNKNPVYLSFHNLNKEIAETDETDETAEQKEQEIKYQAQDVCLPIV